MKFTQITSQLLLESLYLTVEKLQISGGAIFAATACAGTILIDLPMDDPEYLSVEEQVRQSRKKRANNDTIYSHYKYICMCIQFYFIFLQMQGTIREHKDNAGGYYNSYNILKVSRF